MTWGMIGILAAILVWKLYVWRCRTEFYHKLREDSPELAERYRRSINDG
jgi:hypothetical protein